MFFSSYLFNLKKALFALGQGLSAINWSSYSAECTNSCHWSSSFALPVCGHTADLPPAATGVKKSLQVNTLTLCTERQQNWNVSCLIRYSYSGSSLVLEYCSK